MRKIGALLLALALPGPALAQNVRVALDAPLSPAPGAAGTASAALSLSPSAAALTPGPGLSPVLSAPSAERAPELFAAPEAAPARPLAKVLPIKPASNQNRAGAAPLQLLKGAAQAAQSAPEDLGALYDAGLPAPDYEALATVKTPSAPAAWTPKLALLKPAAALVNAWRASRHEARINRLGPDERVTTEELGLRESLEAVHADLRAGRLQAALEHLTKVFKGRDANGWYLRNPKFVPYRSVARSWLVLVENAVKDAYVRAHRRSIDEGLIAEAREAERAGTLLGHEYRRTAIQDKDSAHCAHHALFNAIQASAGFAYPVSVHRFIERARELLNVSPSKTTTLKGQELASLERSIGLKIGVDVGEGMGPDSIAKWASLLGMKIASRGPPRGDAEWSALLVPGKENLIGLRLFHPRFEHSREEAALHGHRYRELRHGVYLLGAFDSPSRGVRLYMVQDSGSGATDFYTAGELSALATDVQTLEIGGAVRLPAAR